MKTSIIKTLLTALACSTFAQAQNNSISIPLPQNQKLELIAVKVVQSDNLFNSRTFDMGYPEGSYQNPITKVAISGTVHQDGYWILPMAKTEITQAQYAAIMTPEQMPSRKDAQLPINNISYSDIAIFIDKLNAYIYSSPEIQAVLPVNSKQYGPVYLRLPLESEWEFCARGGIEVPKEIFEKKRPYNDDEIFKYENYKDQEDKEGRLRAVARRKANPCGLHDMLGNVSEFVVQHFAPEFIMGRSGGHLVRGGDYNSSEKYVTSYTRKEIPPYNQEAQWQPFRSKSIGFRLIMGSSIISRSVDGANNRLNTDWEKHNQASKHVSQPTVKSTASTDEKLQEEQRNIIQRLNIVLGAAKGSNNANIEDSIKRIEHDVNNMKKITAQAQENIAIAGLHMIASASSYGNLSIANILRLDFIIGNTDHPEVRRNHTQERANHQRSLKNHWETMQKGITLLSQVPAEVAQKFILEKTRELQKKEDAYHRSSPAAAKVKLYLVSSFKQGLVHYNFYKEKGSLAGQFNKWEASLKKEHN